MIWYLPDLGTSPYWLRVMWLWGAGGDDAMCLSGSLALLACFACLLLAFREIPVIKRGHVLKPEKNDVYY